MDIYVLLQYLDVIVCGICLCIGFIVKNLIPSDNVNKYIPLMVGVLGVVLTVWVHGSFTPTVLLTGLLSGLASTGLYEAFRNLIESIGKKVE